MHYLHPLKPFIFFILVVKVELEQELSTDMTGLCGNNVPGMTVKLLELIARLYYSNSNISRNTFSSSSKHSVGGSSSSTNSDYNSQYMSFLWNW